MSGYQFDIAIIGSGFGGSILATILSRRGLRVALIDRATHPRFAIGESSTPAADLILADLARQYDLPEWKPLTHFGSWQSTHPDLLCGCKRGFSYLWHGAGNDFHASDSRACELLVTANVSREEADTQWYRPDVDRFFARTAVERGVVLWEGADELRLDHRGEFQWRMSFRHDNEQVEFTTPFVVDASGPAGVVLRTLGIPVASDSLKTVSSALYSHWFDLTPLDSVLSRRSIDVSAYPYPIEQSVIHHLFADGWCWQIPFENSRTSFGFVSSGETTPFAGESVETEWNRLVARSTFLSDLFRQARIASPPGAILRTGRLQRLATRCAGLDWAALPFTVGFVDPLHSTGIAQTLFAVERLAEILLSSFPDRREAAEDYSDQLLRQFHFIDLLVAGCYLAGHRFDRFRDWSMIYFAAATNFERMRLTHGSSVSFLCVDDFDFVRTAQSLYDEFSVNPDVNWTSTIRDAIVPWNHVGLFAPARPNLYFRTASEK